MKGFLPDFCIALIWRRKVPHGWYHRDGFTHSRKLLLLFWLVMGNFILLGYKGTLLSNLIRIQYERPIESYDDAVKSGLKFLLHEFSGSEEWIDAHPYISQMANNLIRFPIWQAVSEWFTEWYRFTYIETENIGKHKYFPFSVSVMVLQSHSVLQLTKYGMANTTI